MKTAAKLFLENGYDATSMKKLAKATGIQAPGIYYYFKSKEEILAQLQETASRRFRENVIDEVNRVADAEERVKVLITNVVTLLINFGEIPLLMLQEFLPAKTNEVRKKTAKEFTSFVRNTLEAAASSKGIQQRIDSTVAAFSLIAMTSWTYRWYDPGGRIAPQSLIDHTIRLFLNGFYAGEVPLREEGGSGVPFLLPDASDSNEGKGRKALLLKKAAQLFLEYGYHGASLKTLAEVTGIKTPAIYHYFKNKEAILSHLQEVGAQRFREHVIEAVDKAVEPEEKVKILISRVVALLIDSGEIPLLMVEDSSSQKPDKERKTRAKEFLSFIRTILQELAGTKGIQKPVDPTVASFYLVAVTSWICKWYDPRGRMSLQEVTSQLIRMFFDGFYGGGSIVKEKIAMNEVRKGRPIMDGIMVLPPSDGVPVLFAGRCARCGRAFFPKKEICPDCFDTGMVADIMLSGEGKLATYTVVRKGLGAKKPPYAIGYIDTPEQVRLIAPLTDCDFDDLRIGMDMEVAFEEEMGDDGTPIVVYKYRPFLERQQPLNAQEISRDEENA